MRLNRKLIYIALVLLLLCIFLTPTIVTTAEGQTSSSSWVNVNPVSNSQAYTSINSNWTLTFQAVWGYGQNSGQPIPNATVTVQITGKYSGIATTLNLNTTSGTFSFNYSSPTADILTFTPTKLRTQDGDLWTSAAVDGVVGFQFEPVTVWYDSFHVALTNFDTGIQGKVAVSANVTYQLLPQDGLTLPAQDTVGNQPFLPKIAGGLNVTINGVKTQEIQPGIYTATVPTSFPTAYILVAVSRNGWTTTYTAFERTHSANQSAWLKYGAVAMVAVVAAFSALYFLRFRKPDHSTPILAKARYPLLSGILLIVVSLVSLYWATLGLDAYLHGFSWLLLAVTGIVSFVSAFGASMLSILKRSQAPVIFLSCVPLLANIIVVKASMDSYMLAVPWLLVGFSLVISVAGALLVSNADKQFNKHPSENR
jgi:hypothetical protein